MINLTEKIADDVVDDVSPFLDALVDSKGWSDANNLAFIALIY